MMEALIGLGGVILGLIGGFGIQWWQERGRKQNIRSLIFSEIEQNCEMLLEQTEDLPTQSREIWASQLPALPGVFSEKEQLEKVHEFYIKLYELHKRRADNKKRPRNEVASEIDKLLEIRNFLNPNMTPLRLKKGPQSEVTLTAQ